MWLRFRKRYTWALSNWSFHQLKPGVSTEKMETFCSLWEQDKLDLDNYLNSIRKIESIVVLHLGNLFIPKVVFVSVFSCCFVFVLQLVRHSLGNTASIISLYIGIEHEEIELERTC